MTLTLGIAGGLDQVDENRAFLCPPGWFHDAAAVLVEDGQVVAAIEEERLNRIKHTSKGPIAAIRFCLERHGARLGDLEYLLVYGNEAQWNHTIRTMYYLAPHAEPVMDLRGLVHDLLRRGLGDDLEDRRLAFVPHHLAHAISAYAHSGFDRSLVVTLDGGGDDLSGLVLHAEGDTLAPLAGIPLARSLGSFYASVVTFLGFGFGEEYKVMGLAPYGDPARYRALFRSFYQLLPEGEYVVQWPLVQSLPHLTRPRRKSEPILQAHKDVAAALQQALEEVVLHLLRHYRTATRHERLCLAGGVAHNCSMNGRILSSGLFADVFVQPASHDAGCAIGAALYPFFRYRGAWTGGAPYPAASAPPPATRGTPAPARLSHVFWGTDIGGPETVGEQLARWSGLVDIERVARPAATAARLLAEGAVLGWVQGRSEFGPRALGNRSIVADPRPAGNRDLINALVKKREAFRPFAPAVLEEEAGEWFELPDGVRSLPFMSFVVKVRESKRSTLGATTHVDGTARIQTVARHANPRFWELIDEFRRLTGVPVVLNTSFNSSVEPIVDSIADAVVCGLTTGLECLVIGDYLVRRGSLTPARYGALVVTLPPYARLGHIAGWRSGNGVGHRYEIGTSYGEGHAAAISPELHEVLRAMDGKRTLDELLDAAALPAAARPPVLAAILDLWSQRLLALTPP